MNGPITPPKPEPEELPVGPYLTIAEAARVLQVSEETLERMIANGEIPAIEITGRGGVGGRRIKRIMRESLDAAMKESQIRMQNEPQRRARPRLGQDDLMGD